ncbi:MAG: S26 family signal peptidase [Phycisphaerales bacterium]
MSSTQKTKESQDSDVVGTLMSLLVAFTLAMAFRGFVLEGFIIPTGSMGPTLMGAHVRIHSPATGYEYPADASSAVSIAAQSGGATMPLPLIDPMISQRQPIGARPAGQFAQEARAGDRVLVLKPLYLVNEPHRWDVVVFKNPTDPAGDTQNYIKRMVGLPNESFLLVDGDVFTGPLAAPVDSLAIARKPEFVQRAVWQPVYHSDYQPVVDRSALETAMRARWEGPPWRADPATLSKWTLSPARAWRFDGTGPTALVWNTEAWPVDDLNMYNIFRFAAESRRSADHISADFRRSYSFPVSDMRIAATIECADLSKFSTVFELTARSSVFRFELSGASRSVHVTRSHQESGELQDERTFAFTPRSDGLLPFEFWHVDQQLWVFIDGELVGQMPYDFRTLSDRVQASCFGRTVEQYVHNHTDRRAPTPPKLRWSFDSAAPFTVHRVWIDRDLYYQPALHDANNQNAINGEYLSGPAFATDWNHPAQVGPDEFVMLGDNSAASRDARLWGRAHRLVLETFGDAQPGIVPRDMIVGRAWAVYFPAPIPMSPGGPAFIPDFGRLRLIR